MTRVYGLSNLDRAHRAVLLAMADHADDGGTRIYPSFRHLANKTGYSPRWISKNVNDLVGLGLLRVDRPATPIAPAEFRIDLGVLEAFEERSTSHSDSGRGELASGGEAASPGEVHWAGPRDEVGDAEPPGTPQLEPPGADHPIAVEVERLYDKAIARGRAIRDPALYREGIRRRLERERQTAGLKQEMVAQVDEAIGDCSLCSSNGWIELRSADRTFTERCTHNARDYPDGDVVG